jgi:hypothetical protein
MERAMALPSVPVRAGVRGETRGHPLGDLEIQYFCWFGAGEIDKPETRVQLAEAWGMCHRHALGFLAVEAAVNGGWLFRPAVVYDAVLDRARSVLEAHWLFGRQRMIAGLRAAEPCGPCALGLSPTDAAAPAAAAIVEEGRDLEPLRAFAAATRDHWGRWICGRCAGTASPARCRLHLADDLAAGGPVDMRAQRQLIASVSSHLAVYARSFGWLGRGTETPADRAALIGAVGWCGGWESILRYLG